MIRTLLTLAAGIGVGVAVTFAADHDHHKAVKVTQLSQRDIIEKLDGKAASATVNEVTFGPGQEDTPPVTILKKTNRLHRRSPAKNCTGSFHTDVWTVSPRHVISRG